MSIALQIAPWKDDAAAVYSVVYDEGTIDCLANAFPVHRVYGVPGDVAAVAGQLGVQRHVEDSSLNDYFHMGPVHLKFLLAHGWSISNHSFCHPPLSDPQRIDFEQEVVRSYHLLEQALGQPVRLFTSWNSHTVYDALRRWVMRTHGYWGLARTANDAEHINGPDFDPFSIWRNRLCEDEGAIDFLPEEFSRRGFRPDAVRGRWLVDVTHLVLHNAPQGHKCITPASLEQRFSQFRTAFGDTLWAATPVEVVRYSYLRRGCEMEVSDLTRRGANVRLTFSDLPTGLASGDLTLLLTFADEPGSVRVDVGGQTLTASPHGRMRYMVTVPVAGDTTLLIRPGGDSGSDSLNREGLVRDQGRAGQRSSAGLGRHG